MRTSKADSVLQHWVLELQEFGLFNMIHDSIQEYKEILEGINYEWLVYREFFHQLEAHDLFQISASKGMKDSCWRLSESVFFRKYPDLPHLHEQTGAFLMKAVYKQFQDAQLLYSYRYDLPNEKRIEILEINSGNNHIPSRFFLGEIYSEGLYGTVKQSERGRELIQSSFENCDKYLARKAEDYFRYGLGQFLKNDEIADRYQQIGCQRDKFEVNLFLPY
jgi:hypothetical protein